MKIICEKDKLYQAFQVVSSVIPLRSTMPILQNVKIVTNQKTVFLIGTDLEAGIQYQVPAEVKEKGQAVLPYQRLGAILRESGAEKIKIETKGNIGLIESGDSHYKLMGADPVDYPDFPKFDPKKAVAINPIGLKEMIRKTIFATSPEITRYALTGILVEIKKKEIRMVGSDGKRLAYVRRKSEQAIDKDMRVIVPSKGMSLLEKIIQDDKTTVKMSIEETQMKVSLVQDKKAESDILIFSRLVEGNFPDYEATIPGDCDKKIELDGADFYAAMRRAALVTTDKFKATKMIFKDNKLTLFSRTQDVGEAKVEMKVKYDHKPFEIVFNPDFFIDFLRVVGSGNIQLELKDKTSPVVMKVGKDYIYLVMPLTVDI